MSNSKPTQDPETGFVYKTQAEYLRAIGMNRNLIRSRRRRGVPESLLHFPGSVHHAERQDQKIHGEEKQGEHQGRLHGQTGIETAGTRRRPPDFRLETGQPEWCLESRFRFVFLFSEGDHQHGTADLHIPSPLSCPEDAAGYPPCLPPRYSPGSWVSVGFDRCFCDRELRGDFSRAGDPEQREHMP